MDIKQFVASASPVLTTLIMGWALGTGTVMAQDREVTVTFQVSAQGLDLNQPAGARELYDRLRHAAQVVCTHGMRVDLVPAEDSAACYEKALGSAVRATHSARVTQVYLETHTAKQAAAYGIAAPVQMAAK